MADAKRAAILSRQRAERSPERPATATLGAALTTLGAGIHFGEPAIVGRAIVIVVFLVLTAPVAAHMIARAGYRRGSRLFEGTICDEAKGRLPRDDFDAGN